LSFLEKEVSTWNYQKRSRDAAPFRRDHDSCIAHTYWYGSTSSRRDSGQCYRPYKHSYIATGISIGMSVGIAMAQISGF